MRGQILNDNMSLTNATMTPLTENHAENAPCTLEEIMMTAEPLGEDKGGA